MSLRLRLGLSFAIVAVTTSLVMVLATPVVIRYGFEPVLPTKPPASAELPSQDASVAPGTSLGPGPSVASPGQTAAQSPGPHGPSASPPPSPVDSGPPAGSPSPAPTASPEGSGKPSPRPSPVSSPNPTGSAVQSGRPSGQPGGSGGGAAASANAAGSPGGSTQPDSGHGQAALVAQADLAAAQLERTALPQLVAGPSAVASPAPPASASPDPASLAWVEVERRTSTLLIVVAVLSGLVSVALGLLFAEALIRPLRRLGRAASAIAGGDLARRSGVGDRRDEIGDLGRSFDTMAAALEQADASRRRFLQDAAHELGTPVTAIQTTASAILDGVYEPERQHLETIRDEARLLGRIVDDLRTIALAEVHQLPIQSIDVDVAATAESTAAAFAAAAANGGRRVIAEASGPAMATGDPDRVRQVLSALVDNALRHVPAGGAVRIRTTVRDGRVLVEVDDDGPGLGDHTERVFDRFYRADAPPDRTAGHAGLGLAIVRALVEAQAGHVSARNRPEGGARFEVDLPGAVPGASTEAAGAGTQPATAPGE